MQEITERVLVVDDEPSVRELASCALTAAGFECDTAADGDEAIQSLSTARYGGVVTDLRMPNRHGHALCELILRSHNPPQVMVVSGLADARLARDLLNRGVYEFVQKPVDFDVLAGKVRSMLNRQAVLSEEHANEALTRAAIERADLLRKIEGYLVGLTLKADGKLDDAFKDIDDLPEPPRSVRNVIKRLEEQENGLEGLQEAMNAPGCELRKTKRVGCFTTVIAAPITSEGVPVDEPFKLALRNLSEGGARLLYTRATNAKYLALRWNTTLIEAKPIRVALKLSRCDPRGRFYDYGGQFVLPE